MSGFDALINLGRKATRRLQASHKPVVRLLRRRQRADEHRAFRDDAEDISRELARIAAAPGPIVAGPWLAEVGYEVLYWIPFLRWFQDAHGVGRDRLVILSRGGMEPAYRELTDRYVDIFDLISPTDLGARNRSRQADEEGGGQKQSSVSALDADLLAGARARHSIGEATLLHPSLMFRLFRHVWHGNLPYDVLWRHTRFAAGARAPVTSAPAYAAGLPADFIAAKIYGGPALSAAGATREAVRRIVAHAASVAPVVLLETEIGVDEHRDFDLLDLPNVTTARAFMTPRTNLGVQLDLLARSRYFLGSCGGLAWVAPFLGVPTVALYDDDRLLAPHLYVARQAGAAAQAAPFTAFDVRVLDRIGLT